MAVAIQSVSTNAMGTGGVITKPTGLAVGDVLLAIVVAEETEDLAAPAGWTSVDARGTATYAKAAAFIKTADASDVAASNFTFTGTNIRGGILYRTTGGAISKVGWWTSPSFIPPVGSTSHVFVFSFAGDNSGRTVTYSGYSVAGGATPVFTERLDSSEATGLTTCFGIADGAYNSSATLTGYGVSLSGGIDENLTALIVLPAQADGQGTNALHSVSPTHFAQAGVAGTAGTNTLLAVSPTMLDQSGRGETPTVWTPKVKTATTWTPEIK